MPKRELVVEMLDIDNGEMGTRGCKTLKHCQKELEMPLEDHDTQTPARKTLKRCSKTSWLQNDIYPTAPCAIAKILPETIVRAQFDQIEIFSHTTIYLLTYIFTFLKFLMCIHAGNPRVPPRDNKGEYWTFHLSRCVYYSQTCKQRPCIQRSLCV